MRDTNEAARAAVALSVAALALGLTETASGQVVVEGAPQPAPQQAPSSEQAPAAQQSAGQEAEPDAPDQSESASSDAVQEVAALKETVAIRTAPRMDAERVSYVAATRPITGQRTTLPVIDDRRTEDGRLWLKVRAPGRSRRTGWITASTRTKAYVGWRVVVDLSERRARVSYLGEERKVFRVVVGKPNTPTPTGNFFVEENIREPPSHGIGPYAIALSARSGVYREFEGGPGQIALHGTGILPGALGSASSHGCIRFANPAINWLGERLDAGTPVVVQD